MSKAKFDEYGHIRVGGKVASTCLGPNEVEKLDFGPIFNILDRFGVREPDLADVDTLISLESTITILLQGYKRFARELVEVPQVCLYLQELHAAWPYGLYFFNTDPETLQLLVWCNCGAKLARNSEGAITGVQVPVDTFRKFIQSSREPYLVIAGQLGWSSQEASRRFSKITSMFKTVAEERPVKKACFSRVEPTEPTPATNGSASTIDQFDLANTALVRMDINRQDIETSNFDPFISFMDNLGILEVDKADLATLKNLQSKIGIFVDGYNDDPRELFELPEVCRYFQTLHKAWPFGLYFFSPATATLQLLVWCNVGAIVASREANIMDVRVSGVNLNNFIQKTLPPTLEIVARLQWPPPKASDFINGIITLFPVADNGGGQSSESDDQRRQRHHSFIASQHATLAKLARSGYQEEGRGFVMIFQPEPGHTGFRAMYINQAGIEAGGHVTQVARQVEGYDPDTQFVVSFYEPDAGSNCSSSYTVKLPAPNPARRGMEPVNRLRS